MNRCHFCSGLISQKEIADARAADMPVPSVCSDCQDDNERGNRCSIHDCKLSIAGSCNQCEDQNR